MDNCKIIFHFKSVPNDIELIDEIKKTIKEFHKNSLTIFVDDLNIHIFEENNNNYEKL